MKAVYPSRIVNRLKALRDEGWTDGRETSDPQIDLVLYRDRAPLEPQEVVVTYLTSGGRPFASSHTLQSNATVETLADVRIRRPMALGFDVQVGDRFVLGTNTGVITQVTSDKGMVWATGRYDSGNP